MEPRPISYNFVREHIKNSSITVKKIAGTDMKADFLTKILGPADIKAAISRVDMTD